MKKFKKLLALLLSVLMVFTMASSSFATAEEPATEKTEIEEVESGIKGIFASLKGIVDGAHDLAGTIIEFFGKDCPFCDEVHNKKDNTDNEDKEENKPTEPEEPKEDSSIKDDIDGAVDAGFSLFNSIHSLVGGILGVFGKECPFCDQVHGDKEDEEFEEPTDPTEPTDPAEPIEKTYSVTFKTNGGSEVEKQTINEGEVVHEPEKPTKEGFSFDGWYTDEDLTEKFDFVTVINSDITLYAAWEEKSEAEQYFEKNSQLIDIVKVEESEDVMTEAEVKSFLEDRGFGDYEINYSYSLDGEFGNETEISETSTYKHPTYQTIYLSKSGEVWIIDVINGAVFANPFDYNMGSERAVQLLVSETNELTSYDSQSDKFFITIPNNTEVIVKVVDRIDAETLDGLTGEELNK